MGSTANVRDLVERLKRGAYRAKLVLRRWRPKGEGKYRPLGLPALEDTLVQIAVARMHPGRQRRFSFLGFEFSWMPDRQGVPRVTRRTARKKLHSACRRMAEWIKHHRHLPGRDFFPRLNARLRGHYNDYGVRGNSRALYRFFHWTMDCTFTWLNRRGGKRQSVTWGQFTQLLDHITVISRT